MKIRISTKELAVGLARLKTLCSARASLPILGTVLLRAEGGGLTIEGSNLDHHLQISLPAKIEEPGSIAVPCAKLQAGVAKMDGDEIMVTTAKDGLVCKSGGKTMRLLTFGAEEFPPRPKVEKDAECSTVGAVVFAVALEKALPFASDDETRYVINGVNVTEEKGKLRVVATDGKRLICVSPAADFRGKAIFTPAAVKMIADLVAPDGEDDEPKQLDVRLTESVIQVEGDGWVLTAKQIEGAYPSWRSVVPPVNAGDVQVTVDRAELLGALPFVQVILREKTGCVKIAAEAKCATVTTSTPDLGEATAELAAQSTAPVTVGFNATYVIDAMNALNAERATFVMANGESPTRIEEPGTLVVLMPMRIS